jgi:hypothetical protein
LTNYGPASEILKNTTGQNHARALHPAVRRPAPGGARVFADDAGRLWNASHATGTVDAARRIHVHQRLTPNGPRHRRPVSFAMTTQAMKFSARGSAKPAHGFTHLSVV